MLDLFSVTFPLLLLSILFRQVQVLTMSPTYSGITNSVFLVGTKEIVTDSNPKTQGFAVYSVSFSQSVSNPSLVLSLNKLSVLMTSNPAVTLNKYLLASPLTVNPTGFSSKLQVFSSATTLYSTTLQYVVYNKLNSLVQALQLSTLYSMLNSTFFITAANNFYFGQNYHEESLTIDRIITPPPHVRAYLPPGPTCIVYGLGYKIESSDSQMAVWANCSAAFSTNQVLVTVSANDNTIVDTYLLSILVYVQPEGRYFGYFDNVLSYSYGATTSNRSQQYLWLSAINYDIYTLSQYSANIAHYTPLMVSANSNCELLFGIGGIAVRNIAERYTFSFSRTLGSVLLSSADPSIQSIVNPQVKGINYAHLFLLTLVECPEGFYYDRVTAQCHNNYGGGDKVCSGPQFVLSLGAGGQIGVAIGSQGLIYSSNGWLNEVRVITYSNGSISTASVSSQLSNQTSETLILSESFLIIDGTLYYNGINERRWLSVLSWVTVNQNITDGLNMTDMSNGTNSTSSVNARPADIYAGALVELVDIESAVLRSFAGGSGTIMNTTDSWPGSGWISPIREIVTLDEQFDLSLALVLNISTNQSSNSTTGENATNLSTDFEVVLLSKFEDVTSEILSLVQADGSPNVTVQDIVAQIKQQSRVSDRVLLTTLHAGTSISSGQGQAQQYSAVSHLHLIIDKFIFEFSISVVFSLHAVGDSPSGFPIKLANLGASDNLIGYLALWEEQFMVTNKQVIGLPVLTLYDGMTGIPAPNNGTNSPGPIEEIHVVRVATNKIDYHDVPAFINISEYSYLETYYANLYYEGRRLFICYVLSNRVVSTLGMLNPFLHSHHSGNASICINYTSVFDYYSERTYESNISQRVDYLNTSFFNSYDGLYAGNPTFNYSQISVEAKMSSTLSTLMSAIGNEGNNGLSNGSSTGSFTGQNIQILMNSDAAHGADIEVTSDGLTTFVLTNTNLLYVFDREQLQNMNESTSIGDLTSMYRFKLTRVVDIYPYLKSTISNSNNGGLEVGMQLMLDEKNGFIVIVTNMANLYVLDCDWGRVLSPSQAGIQGRDYLFEFVQLDIPLPPINSSNNSNSSNSSNDTNFTNFTGENSTNNFTNQTNQSNQTSTQNNTNFPNETGNGSINSNGTDSMIEPEPVQQAPITPEPQGLSQTTIIVVSVVCSALGAGIIAAIYFLFIKAKKAVKVNPEMATRTNLYNTKSEFNDLTHGDKAESRVERITSGKTEAGSLMQFQNSSSNSVINLKQPKNKVKKPKDAPNTSLQTLRILNSPYGDGERGLVQEKDRQIIINYEE